VADKSGLCKVINKLVKADPTKSKAKLLDPVDEHLSDIQNLNFLNKRVNNRVGSL
jgi:hypothetical protein